MLLIFIFFGLISPELLAQDAIAVNSVTIIGLKKTKPHIVLRELDLKKGQTIAPSDTATSFKTNANRVFNTGLFVTVEIKDTSAVDSIIDLRVELKERWYIFPLPILELADRNFNEWRNQRNADIRRIEWGLRFRHDNFRGRNEKLNIVLQGGFTKKYEIFHQLPFINQKRTIGLDYGISYSTNKSVGFGQEDNQLVFLDAEQVLRRRFYTTLGVSFRSNFFSIHKTGLNFHRNTISDELLKVSSFYLGEGKTIQRYFKLFYHYNLNKTNINYYPTEGFHLNIEVEQEGLGLFNDLNVLKSTVGFNKFYQLHQKFYLAQGVNFKASTTTNQPYLNQEGLGYEERFVRGFEPYIIDGQHYAINRNEFKYRLTSFTVQMGKYMPITEFETVPYAIYLKTFGDWGYVSNQDQRLSSNLANRLHYGYGLGIDFVSYYDFVVRIELARNSLNENGVFLHLAKGI